jgi:hypothetical protein
VVVALKVLARPSALVWGMADDFIPKHVHLNPLGALPDPLPIQLIQASAPWFALFSRY